MPVLQDIEHNMSTSPQVRLDTLPSENRCPRHIAIRKSVPEPPLTLKLSTARAGSWDMARAPELHWNEGDRWSVTLDLPTSRAVSLPPKHRPCHATAH
jgi:hypothetical protein